MHASFILSVVDRDRPGPLFQAPFAGRKKRLRYLVPRVHPAPLPARFFLQEHREFSIVRDMILAALGEVCTSIEPESEKTILKQSAVQHLYSKILGRLRPGCGDAHALAALHPTPAVCGQPREQARACISELEPFDRGFYAGPVGWLGGYESEFAVAIRSALLPAPPRDATVPAAGQRTAHLYAGVGVVSGGNSTAEWRELDLKVGPFSGVHAGAPWSGFARGILNFFISSSLTPLSLHFCMGLRARVL